jgi:hypothetical protein
MGCGCLLNIYYNFDDLESGCITQQYVSSSCAGSGSFENVSAGAPANGLSPVLNLSKNCTAAVSSVAVNSGGAVGHNNNNNNANNNSSNNGRLQLSPAVCNDFLRSGGLGPGVGVGDSESEAGAETENDQASVAEDEDFSDLEEDDRSNVGKCMGQSHVAIYYIGDNAERDLSFFPLSSCTRRP